MKGIMPTRLLAIVVVVALWGSPEAGLAGVHDQGVGSCQLCHAMHTAGGGGPGQGGGGGGASLLRDGPASDICLNCHATDSGAVMAFDPLVPSPERGPGNFIFLLSDNLNDGLSGVSNPIPGDAAGHNVRAPGHGLSADGTRMTSPGGTYPANQLKCTSCHDPHGNTNYRMLRGPGNQQGSGGRFTYAAPIATGLGLTAGEVESGANHVAYISGMSLWCANCHFDYLDDHNKSLSNFQHPTDGTLDSDQILQYAIYNGTLDPTGGLQSLAYLAEVPFEDGGNTPSTTNGPTVSSRLMCLTCHRAHATSAPSAGRWDFNVTKLGDDGMISGSYPIPNPYLDPGQDSLCWKCHEGGTD